MESPFQDTRAREPDWAPPEKNTAAPSPPSPPSPPAAPTLRAIGTSVTGTLDSKHLKVRLLLVLLLLLLLLCWWWWW